MTLIFAGCMTTSAKFLGPKSGALKRADTGNATISMNFRMVNAELNAAIGEALGEGHGVSHRRINEIEFLMRDTFRSLHKNRNGRIGLEALRYLIHRYFASSHGWSIKGFEQHGAGQNNGQAAHILKQKLPGYVEDVLETRLGHGGFWSGGRRDHGGRRGKNGLR